MLSPRRREVLERHVYRGLAPVQIAEELPSRPLLQLIRDHRQTVVDVICAYLQADSL